MKYGYDSVDGYQRAFFREFGCNPREYARNPVPICLFKPYGVKYRMLKEARNMEKVRHIFLQVTEKPARKVILKRGRKAEEYFAYCEEVGCDVWGILSSMPAIGGEPVSMWLPEGQIPAGTSKYAQGVEVPVHYSGAVPEGFDVIGLPAGKFLMFQGEPFQEEDFGEAIQEIWDAVEAYDPAVIGYEWDGTNPRIQLEPIGTRGCIELVPIRAKGPKAE